MRLLLDTNIVIARSSDWRSLGTAINGAIDSDDNSCFASVVSLWEIAVKKRVGKLDTPRSARQVAEYFEAVEIPLHPIGREHVLADFEHQPATRDPFDRLLLAICQVEGMRLVTLDRALAAHPLAWR